MDFLDLGGAGFVLGAVLSFAAGTRHRLAVVAFGLVAVLAFLVFAYLVAPTSGDDCSDCSEFYGRWMNGVVLVVAFLNAIGYVLGIVVGTRLRRLRGRTA